MFFWVFFFQSQLNYFFTQGQEAWVGPYGFLKKTSSLNVLFCFKILYPLIKKNVSFLFF